MALLTSLVLIFFVYLLICRYLRFRRVDSIIKKYNHAPLDYLKAQDIVIETSAFDMPFFTRCATTYGLYRTYGIPTISELLVKTDQLGNRAVAGRRAEDTGIILSEFIFHGLDTERARMSIARMNYLHNLYKKSISNDDMLYTLSIFIYEPIRWCKKYDWRPLEPVEKQARFVFWREIGERMKIQNIPPSYKEFKIWAKNYEKEYMVYSESNKTCGEATINLMTSLFPEWMQGFARKLVITFMDERLRLAMDIEDVSPLMKLFTIVLCRVRAFLIRHCTLPRFYADDLGQGPNTCPLNEYGRYNRTGYVLEPWYVKETWFSKTMPFISKRPGPMYKSQGFKVEELGPEKFAGKGLENMTKDAEAMLERACPAAAS